MPPIGWKWKSWPVVAASPNARSFGAKRRDITPLPVRFWTVPKYPNYVIVYRPDTIPLQVVAVLHGKRDLKETLETRPN